MDENGSVMTEEASNSLQEEFARMLAINFARDTEREGEVQTTEGGQIGPEGSLGATGFGSAASALLRANDVAPFRLSGPLLTKGLSLAHLFHAERERTLDRNIMRYWFWRSGRFPVVVDAVQTISKSTVSRAGDHTRRERAKEIKSS
jgi:hypothetical protein